MSHIFKTAILLALLTAMLVLLGGALGGQRGLLVAFVLALALSLGSYWFSDRIVLATYGARPLDGASPATAHLFIVHPLRGRALFQLFSTHPPIEERIARLRAMPA